jgi:uncharacterized protein
MLGLFLLLSAVNAANPLNDYFGVYRFPSNRLVMIRTWDELGEKQLTYFDNQNHFGKLDASALQLLRASPGAVTGLIWNAERGVRLSAIREECVEFSGRSGSLFLPAGAGRHRALVLVHGSGPGSRDFFGPIGYRFAAEGIAVLAYDKRSDWMEADFNRLAEDVINAVAFLKTRPEIDSTRIGLWGISQGGWVAPLAASQTNDISFLILVSAPGVTPGKQILMPLEEELRLKKTPEPDIQKELDKTTGDLNSLRDKETKDYLLDQWNKMKAEGKTEALAERSINNPRYLLFLASILDYDPLPTLEKVRCPVLALYGDNDRIVPVVPNKEILESALKNTAASFITFPKANHAMMECETGSITEFPSLDRFVPEFWDTMIRWIKQQ